LHYQQVVKNPRYEDFEISYFEKNIWAYLGMGWTVQDRRGPKEADVSPHFCLDNIDPKWYASSEGFSLKLFTNFNCRHEANGGDPKVLREELEAYRAENQ
jgi:hypothetical protein